MKSMTTWNPDTNRRAPAGLGGRYPRRTLLIAALGGALLGRCETPAPTRMDMAQTLSDQAQRTTLAFSGLALMTGSLEAQSFFPPGKVADYTGFQYLRDNDPDGMGHNTSFLTRVANNVINILDDTQFAQLQALASAQQPLIEAYGYRRYPLMQAFRRLLEGDLPAGATGLSRTAIQQASEDLYLIDGQISFDRALLYTTILNSLTPEQKSALDAMKGKGWNSWPNITDDQIRARMRSLPPGSSVAVMTYASDLFSWYAGSVEADVYFCPERHGTYYGGFYIKDAPAVGHEGYSINEQLTATAGAALCDSTKGYVTADQAARIATLVDLQRSNLYASATHNIVQIRTTIATLLRGLLVSTNDAESVNDEVLELSALYGSLDGENNYHYATVFAEVYASLGEEQRSALYALRHAIMSGTYTNGTPFDYTECTTPFLYSSVIADPDLLAPYVTDTDYLFATNPVAFTGTHHSRFLVDFAAAFPNASSATFGARLKATIGGKRASIWKISPTSVLLEVPASLAAGTHAIAITDQPSNGTSQTCTLTVAGPEIETVTFSGNTLVITGTLFGRNPSVTVNGRRRGSRTVFNPLTGASTTTVSHVSPQAVTVRIQNHVGSATICPPG